VALPTQRVLDLDLDAFVYGSGHWRAADAPRLDSEDFCSWEMEKVMSFLELNCGLSQPLPGYAVEHHGELFFRWRDAIDAGLLVPPFEVVHVDAHADVGLGDYGYMYLLTELLQEPVDSRRNPRTGDDALSDGNYLNFAIANRWISKLLYVIGGRSDDTEVAATHRWQPGDLLPYIFEDFDLWTRTIRLPTLDQRNLSENLLSTDRLQPLGLEPPVPFDWVTVYEFAAEGPFDMVCLARSPSFTPAESDAVYDAIRERFIDESIRSPGS
jgi:hypothetical protein